MTSTPTAVIERRAGTLRSVFSVGPLPAGLGHTLGQALQSVLRSHGPGARAPWDAAPTVERWPGARHGEERLAIDVACDGAATTPRAAMRAAAAGLIAQVDALVEEAAPARPPAPDPLLLRPVDELHLSVRASNALQALGIRCIGELLARTERDLLRTPGLGRRAVQEIQAALGAWGLLLGSLSPGWRP